MEPAPQATIDRFLAEKERDIGVPPARIGAVERRPYGWVVHEQSRADAETDEVGACSVGPGPNILRDDGRLLEGGSLDRDAAAVPRRCDMAA